MLSLGNGQAFLMTVIPNVSEIRFYTYLQFQDDNNNAMRLKNHEQLL